MKALRARKHSNKRLQADWNKYGSTKFEFLIAKICRRTICRNKLYDKEQMFLDKIENKYNVQSAKAHLYKDN